MHRFRQELRIDGRQVNEVIAMNDQWLQVIFPAQVRHDGALIRAEFIRFPLPRTRREHLQRITSQPVRSFCRVLYAASSRGMNAYAPGSQLGRVLWRRDELQNILFEL